MKDIDEVKDIQPLSSSAAGVWQLEPEVCILYTQWTRSWAGKEGPEHTHNSTILFLKEAHSPRNFDWPPLEVHANSTAQPGQYQKDDIPHHSHTTHFLRGWSKSTSTQSTTFHTLTASPPARLCPPFHLHLTEPDWKASIEGAWQKLKGYVVRGSAHPHVHINGASEQCTSPESQAQLEASMPASISTHTHCTWTTRHACKIRVKWLLSLRGNTNEMGQITL